MEVFLEEFAEKFVFILLCDLVTERANVFNLGLAEAYSLISFSGELSA